MSTTDVLIIGAGPVGMTMAMELSLQGVDFRIIEKSAVRSDQSRSLVNHARTLELLSRYPHIEEMTSKAAPITGLTIWLNRKKYEPFDITKVKLEGTRFAGPLMISQVETESFLSRRLAERNVQIERPVTAKNVKQDADGATVVLDKDGVEETVRCKYVVGSDGAHSIVRHSTNIRFVGDAYKQEFILADAQLDWSEPIERVYYALGDATLIMLPLHGGLVRVMASRPYHNSEADPDIEEFQELMTKMLPGKPKIHDPVWLTRYHLHHRCVDNYSDGRLFVAGDAAHIHSPIGGQGMNTGIQDAINLGWKLASVLRGDKSESLLDSYHDERWPVGQHLITQTDQAFTLVTTVDPGFTFLRNLALPYILPWSQANPHFGGKAFQYVSGLNVRYRDSEIVGTATRFDGPIRGGLRASDGITKTAHGQQGWLQDLLRGPTHHLLLFAGTSGSQELEAVARRFREAGQEKVPVHVITTTGAQDPKAVVDVSGELHRVYGFTAKPGYVYVRPDGYVEHIGTLDQVDELFRWLEA